MENKPSNTPESRPRPDSKRPLDAPMLNFDLTSMIERIKQEDEWNTGTHNAITIMKTAAMRIVLIAMHAGNEIKMHQSEGPISVYVIDGLLQFNTEKESVILKKGQLLTLHENIKHGLIAMEETTFLLTMTNVK